MRDTFMFYQTFNGDIDTGAFIQYQDATGNWITCGNVPNQSPLIIQGMQQAASLRPGARIRAVDGDGRFIDNL